MYKEIFSIGRPVGLSFDGDVIPTTVYKVTGIDVRRLTIEVRCAHSLNGLAYVCDRSIKEALTDEKFQLVFWDNDKNMVTESVGIHMPRTDRQMTRIEFRSAITKGFLRELDREDLGISTDKPLFLSFEEDGDDYPIETTVLSIDVKSGVIFVVDPFTGGRGKITGLSDVVDPDQSAKYQSFNIFTQSASTQRPVWLDLGESV